MALDKFLSPYIISQFPRLYREEGPAFIAFVKAYYEWMEQEGGLLYDAKSLPEYRDIDLTLDEYLVHFKNKFMVGLPENALGDKRTLQKHIKEIYSSKGTVQGLDLLFRLLYNENSEVYLPGDDILRPSDGVWTQPVYLEVSVNPFNTLLIGEKITGRESGATAIVEDFQTRYINRRQINVLFLSNVRGDFKTSELILAPVIEDPLNSPTVIGSMSEILVNESGFGFKVGDVLEVGAGAGLLGKAVVASVSPRSGAVAFTVEHGGSGFANNNVYAPNVITVTPIDLDNPGIGADFEIGDTSNTEVIVTAVDVITPYANTQLNSPDYQFPTNVGTENINTPLNQALNVQNITVGTIRTLRAINPGAGYNGPVLVTVDNPVISGLMIHDEVNGDYKGNNAIVTGKAASGNGAIDKVKILNSGIGYANGDIVTLSGANSEFVAGGVVLLGKQGHGEGFWKDTRSFLNSDKYIQDSFYYQDYSYETRLSVAFNHYSDLLKKLWHPAGTQGFGKVVIITEVDSESDAVEVDFVASRITEYMTQFSTFVLTTGATSTQFITQYATQYPTQRPTETTRSTSEDFLINQPNLVINGAFTFNIDSWSAYGDSTASWANAAMQVTRATNGAAYQYVNLTNGAVYQLDFSYANNTGTNVQGIIQAAPGSAAIAFVQKTGASGNATLNFTATSNVLCLTFAVNGTAGVSAKFDDIQLREVPTITQQTEFGTVFLRDTSVDGGSRQTVYNTTTTFASTFNTAYNTVFSQFPSKNTAYLTQLLTASQPATNRATSLATSTVFDTTFDTTKATNRSTSTSRVTSFATSIATLTTFDTGFDTAIPTNRATTTAFVTSYDTVFGTSKNTTTTINTTYGTVYATNRASDTVFNTNKLTNTVFNTSKSTSESAATSRSTTTTFDTTKTTSKSTDTSRVTTYVTTYATTYNTLYMTLYPTVFLQDTFSYGGVVGQTTFTVDTGTTTAKSTSVNTSRNTSPSTFYATTTSFITSYATNIATTTSFNTVYNTLTTAATNVNTTTTFATNRATATTFDTTGQTTIATSFVTATTYNTNFATNRATNNVTTTAFNTNVVTGFSTNRTTSSVYDTSPVTSFNTTTAFNTAFATNRSTNRSTTTAYDTLFLTNTTKLTNVLTNRATNTTVPTSVTTLTNRSTSKSTNRATATQRTTVLVTSIATTVGRQTSKTTVFVAYPTTFITGYLTGTTVATDYVTGRNTQLATSTAYDTEYPTERMTAVLTQTDVAD